MRHNNSDNRYYENWLVRYWFFSQPYSLPPVVKESGQLSDHHQTIHSWCLSCFCQTSDTENERSHGVTRWLPCCSCESFPSSPLAWLPNLSSTNLLLSVDIKYQLNLPKEGTLNESGNDMTRPWRLKSRTRLDVCCLCYRQLSERKDVPLVVMKIAHI